MLGGTGEGVRDFFLAGVGDLKLRIVFNQKRIHPIEKQGRVKIISAFRNFRISFFRVGGGTWGVLKLFFFQLTGSLMRLRSSLAWYIIITGIAVYAKNAGIGQIQAGYFPLVTCYYSFYQ